MCIRDSTTPVVLYSMQIELPDDPGLVGDSFYIDNIYVPPAGDWLFQEYPPGSPTGYAPDFQWMPNASIHNPTAPPVAFEIAEPKCEFAGKSTNPNIVYIPNDSVTPPPVDIADYDISLGKEGTYLLPVTVGFTGDIDDVRPLASGNIDLISEKCIGFTLLLEKLPRLCQLEGVRYIRLEPKIDLELNYSTDDIDCIYSNIQSTLGVSGDSVIIGIIDGGLDWLHEDFIDSNGNTRIRHLGDWIEQTRIPLV